MLNLPNNIDTNDRVSRALIGAALLLAGLIGLGRIFLILAGIVLIAEAVLGSSWTPIVDEKIKLRDYFKGKKENK